MAPISAIHGFHTAHNAVLVTGILVGLFAFCLTDKVSAMATPNMNDGFMSKPAETQRGFDCEVRRQVVSGGLQLDGVIRAHEPLTGSYMFNVTKEGVSGSSTVTQRGLFTAEPGTERIVGTITVNDNRGDTYLVQLQITSSNNDTICDIRTD